MSGSSNNPAPAPTFSYAQAAKGLKSAATSNQSSRAPSGAITPAKDSLASPALGPDRNGDLNWAEDVDPKAKGTENSTPPQVQGITTVKQATTYKSKPQLNGNMTPPSPDFVASSTSTLVRDDDTVSIPNASSESTWEDKSQTSNTAEKSAEADDKAAGGDKKKPTDKDWSKPAKILQEAPAPAINIWQKRMEEKNAKVLPKQGLNISISVASGAVKPTSNTKSADPVTNTPNTATERKPEENGAPRGNEKPRGQKREPRPDESSNKARRHGLRSPPQDSFQVQSAPPPLRNEELWPTPETALGGDRKAVQEKPERSEADNEKEKSASAPKGKVAWKVVPFVPTVLYNTPLPGAVNSRRGGRNGGGRGGRDGGSRGPPSGSAVAENGANGNSVNGDSGRRDRLEGAPRSTSPAKGKRSVSEELPARRDGRSFGQGKDGAAKDSSSTIEGRALAKGSPDERTGPAAQHGTFPRQNGSHFKTNRRQEPSHLDFDKRKDNKSMQELSSGEPGISPAGDAGRSRPGPSTADEERKSIDVTDATPSRLSVSDRKFGPSQSFGPRDNRRGSVRGGRNGPIGFHANQQGANGQAAYQNMAFGMSRSPTLPQDAFFGQQQNSRGFRAPPRAQSMGIDTSYARYPNGFTSAGALTPLNTFMGQPGQMQEYTSAHAMSAIPYSPYIDQYALIGMVSMQLEYYFSLDNLCKDMYLRKHMDSQGFVTLTIIADFNRIKALCQDLELLKFVCQQSHNIEYRLGADGQDRLRKREGWEKWVLEMAQRDPSAQNDGPGEMKFPPPPLPPGDQQSVSVPHRQASLPLQTSPLLAPPINGVSHAQQDVRGEPHEFNTYSRYQGSPPGTTKALHSKHNSESVNATNGVSEKEKDAFSDAQVEKLSVMVRPAGAGSSNVNDRYSNRTLSNGSIASGSLEGLESLNGIAAGSGPNGAASSHESDARLSPPPHDPVPPFSPESRHLHRRNLSRSGFSDDSGSPPKDTYWVKDKESPAHEFPENASSELYVDMREKALEQLRDATADNYPHDMIVLYQFWSHFLVRNFNTRMYEEFRQLAEEDSTDRIHDTGKQNLIKYYGAALLHDNPIRDPVLRDIISIVQNEKPDNERTAFKTLRSAWRNGALHLKTRKKIRDMVDPQLLAQLNA